MPYPMLRRTGWWAIPLMFSAAAMPGTAALAAPATVFSDSYLRAGPGEQYAALDEVEPHSQVDVLSCDKNWCRVRFGRSDGFVRADILSAPDIHAKPGPPPADAACFTARVNGRPSGGELVRVCNGK